MGWPRGTAHLRCQHVKMQVMVQIPTAPLLEGDPHPRTTDIHVGAPRGVPDLFGYLGNKTVDVTSVYVFPPLSVICLSIKQNKPF